MQHYADKGMTLSYIGKCFNAFPCESAVGMMWELTFSMHGPLQL